MEGLSIFLLVCFKFDFYLDVDEIQTRVPDDTFWRKSSPLCHYISESKLSIWRGKSEKGDLLFSKFVKDGGQGDPAYILLSNKRDVLLLRKAYNSKEV